MSKGFWQSANDLALLFSARPIAIPLILLLLVKLYTLDPATLVYSLGLSLITTLFAMRWSIHLIARNKMAFAKILRQQKKQQK